MVFMQARTGQLQPKPSTGGGGGGGEEEVFQFSEAEWTPLFCHLSLLSSAVSNLLILLANVACRL
jgi:hypothetical protein